MKLSTTRVFPLALMAALALLSFYLERAVREEEAPSPVRRHDPDYVVSNFTATTYNKAGAAESLLSAAKMIHYPDDDSTELIEPHLVQRKPDEARMTVRAERGALSRDGDELFLYDSVLLTREAERGQPEARLTTSFLHVLRDKSLALTDREVLMEEGTRSLAGRGMEYHYDSGQMILRDNVRARFQAKEGS